MGSYLRISIRGYTIAVLLVNTGLRVSELCDLKTGDICNGIVTVRWGKGAKRRQVPMNEHAKVAIENWLTVRQSETDYLFSTWNGRITRQVVLFHLAEIGRELGFKLTPHLLRHTFGKALADKNVPLDRIAKLMGHANVNTTAIYTMPSMDDLRRVVESLDGNGTD
jgi:integrase/recombinase XerC